MKEEIYQKMCAYFSNDEKQLAKFKKFYEHYSDFGNFESNFINDYKTIYEQFKDEFEVIFDKYRVKEEPIVETKVATSSKFTEIPTDPTQALLYEMAKDLKKTSQWMQFIGIIVLVGVVLSVIMGLMAS